MHFEVKVKLSRALVHKLFLFYLLFLRCILNRVILLLVAFLLILLFSYIFIHILSFAAEAFKFPPDGEYAHGIFYDLHPKSVEVYSFNSQLTTLYVYWTKSAIALIWYESTRVCYIKTFKRGGTTVCLQKDCKKYKDGNKR